MLRTFTKHEATHDKRTGMAAVNEIATVDEFAVDRHAQSAEEGERAVRN